MKFGKAGKIKALDDFIRSDNFFCSQEDKIEKILNIACTEGRQLELSLLNCTNVQLNMFIAGYNNGRLTPTERWQKKAGLISKTYKLDKKLTEDFAEACRNVGISQAKQLTIMMQDFIDKDR